MKRQRLNNLSEIEKQIVRRFVYMKNRCYNINNTRYKDYGGKGITICEEWLEDKRKFIKWSLENNFSPELSIDRIDNTKEYSPENCRWTNKSIQSQNTRKIYSTNKSGYRGVSWNSKLNKWECSIGINNKTISLGFYKDKLEAAKVYDTYVLDNNLKHTINGVILSGKDKRYPNIGQTLIESNTSGYAGVVFIKRINKWFASVEYKNKKYSLKYHDTAIKAAIIRDIFILQNNIEERRIKRNFPDKALGDLEKWKI